MDSEADLKRSAAFSFDVEAFTLLAVGLLITAVRTYARISQVRFKGLKADDYLAWAAAILYTIETSLAYCVGAVAGGLANSGMTDDERLAMIPGPELEMRVIGSKIQLAGWSTYSMLLWTLKASLLMFYMRLTAGLDRLYRIRILIGFGLLTVSFLVVMTNLFLACRPFYKNWQIYPDPGNVCQPAIANQIVWVFLSMNVSTDLYLISIPMPMLWQSSLRPWKKVGLIILFSGGLFVVICATLRCVLIVAYPVDGALTAGSWAVRETFVAVATTNLPAIVPLLKVWISPIVGTLRASFKSSKASSGPTPGNIKTIGGGGNQSWRGRGPRTPNPITDFTFNESEERMVVDQLKMQNLRVDEASVSSLRDEPNNNIRKHVEINIIREARDDGNDRKQLGPSDEENQRQQGNYAYARGPRLSSYNAYNRI